MKTFELVATCHFGLEAVLKREIIDLGYDISEVADGHVTFVGDGEAIAVANINLRTAERVLLKIAKFKATTFTELFDAVKALKWEEYLPVSAKFWVSKATSVRSKLFSASDIQSIVKKAIVERLKTVYHKEWFDEDGASYPIHVSFLKDEALIAIDTSGEALHKRGYRKFKAKAPIAETIAAALIMLTPWKADRILVDPFCGSGTFPIEAALMAANIAPGLRRNFVSEAWDNISPKEIWDDIREEAEANIDLNVETDIQGFDINPNMIRIAKQNAKDAGVENLIHFQVRPVSELSHMGEYGFIITNPPYGERLEEKKNLPKLYGEIGDAFASLDTWSKYVITAYEDAENYIGRKADKNRKVYNGMLKTYFYQFLGPKPPRRNK